MRYLVTGGAGFIGSHLVDSLLLRGDEVVVLDDLSMGRRSNLAAWQGEARLRFELGSVTDAALVDRLVAEVDRVVHLAAVVGVPKVLADPLRALQVNAFGSQLVLEAASRHRRPVVLASSSEVYGDGAELGRPFAESDSLRLGPTSSPRGGYGCAKALAEWAALAQAEQTGLPVMIVRLFNVAGPRQRASQGMVLARLCRQARRGEALTVFGDGRQTRCFAHVDDVVESLTALLDREDSWGSVFNLGSDREVSILELARLVLARSGGGGRIVHQPLAEVRPGAGREVRRRIPSLRKLEAAIGVRPDRPLTALIDDVLAARSAQPA